MSLNKNKSEIVESFKNLLKKADEAQDIEKGSKNIPDNNNYEVNLADMQMKQVIERDNSEERLGIRDIKRIPSNPFKTKKKRYNKIEYEKFEYELTSKTVNIMNRHLYHWLNRELPKYTKSKLRMYIYELLSQLIK